MTELTEELARASQLADAQSLAARDAGAAVGLAKRHRRSTRPGYLKVIVRAGQKAAKSDPALERVFRSIPPNLTNRGFLTEAWAVLIEATKRVVEQYASALEDAAASKTRQVAATAELNEKAADLMDVLVRLDGFNRQRFADEPERYQARRLARAVSPRRHRKNGTEVAEAIGG